MSASSCTCRVPVGVNGKKEMISVDGNHGPKIQSFLRGGGSFSDEKSLKRFIDGTDGNLARVQTFAGRGMQRMSAGVA